MLEQKSAKDIIAELTKDYETKWKHIQNQYKDDLAERDRLKIENQILKAKLEGMEKAVKFAEVIIKGE